MTVKLTFVEPGGTEQTVEATIGTSVMKCALSAGIDGISAECNGNAVCATCHAVFDEALLRYLPEMEEHENDMLDFAASARRKGSRLSCQVQVTDDLNGARIILP